MKVCFNGCSFTEGVGFEPHQRPEVIYDRLVCRELGWSGDNIAVGGSSNHGIFMRSAQAIRSGQYQVVATQWSSLNRQWFYPGPDTVYFTNDGRASYRYRHINLDKSNKKFFDDTVRVLNHDYQNIIDLIDYCGILQDLGRQHGTRIVMINGLVPWTTDLVHYHGGDLQHGLSAYTKQILDFAHRSDQEVRQFFMKLQTKFAQLDQTQWVNLFDSFMHNCMDLSPTDHHPGEKSHRQMANRVLDYLQVAR